MKYSEIIDVQKFFKSAFDITSDKGETWKTFISNEKFESNLAQIINCFTSPVLNNRKSIWIQGTYGTGKSHSLAVIKHLLCDDYSTIEDYISRISRSQLRNSISTFRQEKRVFPVVLKGVYAIADVADLTYTIQQQVAAALGDLEISTKTDFQSALQIVENGTFDSFFKRLMNENIELHSYAANKQQLIKKLKQNDTKVIRILANELKNAGLGGFRTHNIIEWLIEIKTELRQRGIADYLLLMWDEFTSLLDIPPRRSILNVMQDIAELSSSEVNNSSDTQGIYLLLVTHKKLETTESFKELKEDERSMAKARFIELDYGMQPTTTFHILSGALERKRPDVLNELRQKNFIDVPSVRMLVDKVVDSEATNVTELKEKIVSLYPFHPYTSYLATFVSRVVGEAERSIFGFLNDTELGFKKFIELDINEKNFLTADYVWDFFYKVFEENLVGHFDVITNKFKLVGETLREKGENYYAVFKTILLLNILYRVTTTDADLSEKSMVNPSTENIVAAFSGVLSEDNVLDILDYIDENQILHRNPDGIFEVASSSLPQKKILEEKKNLYSNEEDVSKIVEKYSISCLGILKKNISREIPREVDVQVFWGGEKEHLLRGKLAAKFKVTYSFNVAVMLFRGTTRELDEFLNRKEISQDISRGIICKLSQEDDFRNIVFVLVSTELGNKRFEAYLESLAQESVARTLQMDEEKAEGQKNAEKWIKKWMDEIITSGMAEVIFRGDSIRVPFNQCNRNLADNHIKTIFRYGFDSLVVANTAWKHQTSKKAVELALYSSTKNELEQSATNADSAIRYLLFSGNSILFDERLELVSDDNTIPMVKICDEVKAVLEKNKNETSINLAEKFRYLTKPEYGYYQNKLFMGAFALALRPYIDKLYTSGNGQRIDKTVMKEVIVSIFEYWENSKKYNDKFVVRMSTEEERALTEKLCTIFELSDQDGLIGTKWAIRTQFKDQSQAPLWALKYVDNNTDKYNAFIDKMFKFSKSTDESIQQSFIVELLEGLTIYGIEFSDAVARVRNSYCLDSYILGELESIGEKEEVIQSVKEYLDRQMSGDIVFWEEKDVHEQILQWKIKKDNRTQNTGTSLKLSDGIESIPMDVIPTSSSIDNETKELRNRVKEKIEQHKTDAGKFYEILMFLADKYISVLGDIDNLL
ncbi:MAG: hypothetical protein K2L07_04210 [Lachnospiraceae bacterium]|nr:hypothetical protein [Lachnospiraceae bacterium]